MTKLLYTEIRDLQREVPELISRYNVATAAFRQSAMAVDAIKIRAAALKRLTEIGNRLTSEMVCACPTIDVLLDKWTAHGYRPTLRGRTGSPEMLLADIYDLIAESRGIEVRAFRG